MKSILLLSLFLSVNLYASDNASTSAVSEAQAEINALKKKVEQLEKSKSLNSKDESTGLKMTDLKQQNIKSSNTSGDQVNQLSAEDQKKLQDALKKGEEYLKERNKFLEELDNE